MSKRKNKWHWPVISLAVALWLISLIGLVGCSQGTGDTSQMALGDPRQGAALIGELGCNGCHTVPGVRTADGTVGPPLSFWSDRMYIAGRLVNSPDNTAAWILAPQAVEPGTAMPDMHLSVTQARNITAYLYTLGSGRAR